MIRAASVIKLIVAFHAETALSCLMSASAFWDAFVPINFQSLKDVIDKLKPSFCI